MWPPRVKTFIVASECFENLPHHSKGFVIIQSLLGPEYVFYVTMTMAVGTFVLWTYGIYLMSGDMSQISFKKIVTNPAVIALAIGLVLFFAPIHLPAMVNQVLTGMANLNTGLAMLVLGANLGIPLFQYISAISGIDP